MNSNSETFDRKQYMPPQQPAEPVSASPVSSEPVPASPSGVTSNEPPEGKPRIPGAVIAGSVILILVICVIAYALSRSSQPSTATQGTPTTAQQQGETRVIPTIDSSRAAVEVVATDRAAAHTVGQEFTIQILANSQGADIYGYDLLFPYDKEAIEIVSVTSTVQAFQISPHDRDTYYSVTGIKSLNETGVTAFDNTAILEITLKGLKAGTYYFEVLPELGKETSQFVDKDMKVVQPQIAPIKLEIR